LVPRGQTGTKEERRGATEVNIAKIDDGPRKMSEGSNQGSDGQKKKDAKERRTNGKKKKKGTVIQGNLRSEAFVRGKGKKGDQASLVGEGKLTHGGGDGKNSCSDVKGAKRRSP